MQTTAPESFDPVTIRFSQQTHGPVIMTCRRCEGLMCPAELRDWESSPSQDCPEAFRCITCGEIVDAVIISNLIRARQSVRR